MEFNPDLTARCKFKIGGEEIYQTSLGPLSKKNVYWRGEEVSSISASETNWFACDKEEKLLYGIRTNFSNRKEKEILMRSIFHPEIKVIKSFQNLFSSRRYIIGNYIPLFNKEISALSSGGVYIAVMQHWIIHEIISHQYDYRGTFYLVSLETSETKTFQLILPSNITQLNLLHSSTVGWICSCNISRLREGVITTDSNIYCIMFDDLEKTCSLKFLTDIPKKMQYFPFQPCILDKNFFQLIDHSFAHVYDFEMNLWNEKLLDNKPISCVKSIIGSKVYLLSDEFYGKYSLYKLINDHWDKLTWLSINISITPDCESHEMFVSPKINHMISGISCSNKIFCRIFIDDTICLNTNVPSLQDIAAKRIFTHYDGSFKIQNILQEYLGKTKEQYLGQTWTWDQS